MSEQEVFQRAIQAIQNGDAETGRQLLIQVLQADPKNAQAWLWMSEAVDSDDQKADCLRRASALPAAHAQERRLFQAEPTRLDPFIAREDETTYPFPTMRANLPHAEPELDGGDSFPLFTAEARTGQATPEPTLTPVQRTPALAASARERGYRNTLIAGALLLLLVAGLSLLFHTVTTIVPQAQERLRPTPEAVLYTATLWCPPCHQAGSQIVLWEKVGDGVSRGGKTGELPHDTPVSVLAEEWSEPEERRYYKVTALGQKGWIPDTFLKK